MKEPKCRRARAEEWTVRLPLTNSCDVFRNTFGQCGDRMGWITARGHRQDGAIGDDQIGNVSQSRFLVVQLI